MAIDMEAYARKAPKARTAGRDRNGTPVACVATVPRGSMSRSETPSSVAGVVTCGHSDEPSTSIDTPAGYRRPLAQAESWRPHGRGRPPRRPRDHLRSDNLILWLAPAFAAWA